MVVGVGIGSALPAEAGEGAPVVGVRVERYLAVTVTVRLDGNPTAGEAHGFERRVDPTGRVLRDTAVTPTNGGDPLPPLGDFGCGPHGHPPGFGDL